MSPLQILLSSFAISAFAGLIAILRSKQRITIRSAFSATGYAGLMGLIIGLLWMKRYGTSGDPYFLIGVAGVAGLSGLSVVDLVVMVAKKSGITLQFARDKKDGEEKPE